jgi:F-type H+-transporting ATPase subunit b
MVNLFATAPLILAAEEDASGTDLLLPVAEELIAGIIAFSIVFFFVWRFAVPALNEMLANRQAAVKGELEAAEAAKVEAESLLTDYRQQLDNARTEANRIVEEARQAGEAVRADIVAKAEQEAEAIKTRARDEVAGERQRASDEIRREVASLSLDVAEKVMGESLDRGAQQGLVDRYIDELGGVNRS